MPKMPLLSAVIFLVWALFIPQTCDGSAISFSSAPTAIDSQLSLGWQFTTLEDIFIESLGYYDDGLDGFATAHTVGMFNSSGELIISTFLGAGIPGIMVDQFRYLPVTPFSLPSGATYTIAATTGGPFDPWAYGNATTILGFAVDPAIEVASDASRFLYHADDVLHFPTSQGAYTVYAGPNFIFSAVPSAVPEPSAFLLLGSGLMGLAMWALRANSFRDDR